MHPIRHHGRQAARPLAVACTLVLASLAALPSAAHADPKVLRAGHATARADRVLVTKARAAARCRRDCGDRRDAVQRAADRLAYSANRLTRVVQASPVASTARRQAPPAITVQGRRLSWKRQSRLDVSVLARSVPGQPVTFSLVHGTRVTPPATPGVTVTYSVRRAVAAAQWAPPVAIAYPASRPAKALRAVDAPQVTATPKTVSWSPVATVRDYIVVAKTQGQPNSYRVVRGTSMRTTSSGGLPVTYSVRTAVVDSAWGTGQPVTPVPGRSGPAAPKAPAAAPTPSTPGYADPSGFQFGVNSGGNPPGQLPAVKLLGARHARMEFDIDTPVSEIARSVEVYVRAGIQPLLLASFAGRLPTSAEARALGTWAAAFGPGGSQWGGSSPAAAVTQIEFGNETSYPYQYPGTEQGYGWWADPGFLQRARDYAQRAKEAVGAIRAANPGVGLLVAAEQSAGDTTWVDAMFAQVPELGSLVAGWTVHPYKAGATLTIDRMVSAFARLPNADKPIYATELGFASDDGRCLSDNYEWNRCMGFGEAASSLAEHVANLRQRYGARLAAIYLYSTSDLSSPGASTDREQYFGALRTDRSAKGAYTTEVKALLAASA